MFHKNIRQFDKVAHRITSAKATRLPQNQNQFLVRLVNVRKRLTNKKQDNIRKIMTQTDNIKADNLKS
jgi:hypothetical protein